MNQDVTLKHYMNEHFEKIALQIQQSIKTTSIGWIEAAEWQKKCQLAPNCTVNLLEPSISQFPWQQINSGEATVDISQCDIRLHLFAKQIHNSSDGNSSDVIVPFRAIRYSKSKHPFETIASGEEEFLKKLIIIYLPTASSGGSSEIGGVKLKNGPNLSNLLSFISFDLSNSPSYIISPVVANSVVKIVLVFKVYGDDLFNNQISTEKIETSLLPAITIPDGCKNILLVYPELKLMASILEKSKFPYIKVYYPALKDNQKTHTIFAYQNINRWLPNTDGEMLFDFSDLLNSATIAYPVEYMIEAGEPKQMHIQYEYKGQCSYETKTMYYNIAFLINPDACRRCDILDLM